MMTVIDYADKVFEIMIHPANAMEPWLEDHEVECLVKCHESGRVSPSQCAFVIGDGRDRYNEVLKEECLYDRIDQQLRRAA